MNSSIKQLLLFKIRYMLNLKKYVRLDILKNTHGTDLISIVNSNLPEIKRQEIIWKQMGFFLDLSFEFSCLIGFAPMLNSYPEGHRSCVYASAVDKLAHLQVSQEQEKKKVLSV